MPETRGANRLALRRGLLCAALAVVAATYCVTHFRLDTDVARLLPDSASEEDSLVALLAQRLADSELSRTMILTLRASSLDSALAAGRELENALAQHPGIHWVRGGVDDAQQAAFYELYFARRHLFLSEHPEQELPERLSDDGLRRAAARLRAELARPTAGLVKRIAREDPLLAFPAILERLQAGNRNLGVRDGRLVANDGRHAVLILATNASAFDADPQEEVLHAIDSAVRDLRERLDPELVIERSGMNRFGVRIRDEIQSDIRFIMLTSMLGVALLFLVFMRSPVSLLVAMVPHFGGVLAGATVGLLAFGSLNAMAVAFGISLVGVSIDYAIHVQNHHRLRSSRLLKAAESGADPSPGGETWSEADSDGRATARMLRPSLLLGGATTVASFTGLAFAGFPGFWQMGLLAAVGVTAALFLSLWLIPVFLRPKPAPVLASRLAAALGRTVRGMRDARAALALLIVACVLAGVWGAPRVRWADDISRLTLLDPDLLAEEERVRGRVARFEGSLFVVSIGDDEEQALRHNDRAARRLAPLVGDGLSGLRSLHAFLWSRELQETNAKMLAEAPDLAARVEAIFDDAGFRKGSFAPFAEALARPVEPLDLASLRASPVGDLVRSLVIELPPKASDGGTGEQGIGAPGDAQTAPGRTAIVTYLEGVSDPQAVADAVADLPGTRLLDQRKIFEDIYAAYRANTVQVVASGALSVIALLWLRYRRWRPTLAAFLPSGLVGALLIFLAAATGIEANLLHVIGLVLVLGMGVDYGIFVVDSCANDDELDATLLSLLLSCLTTIFIFGLLALARHPVLSAIGVTTGVGVLLSFLLAPAALVVVARDRPDAPAAPPRQPQRWPKPQSKRLRP